LGARTEIAPSLRCGGRAQQKEYEKKLQTLFCLSHILLHAAFILAARRVRDFFSLA
jgi:hypothetical protein